MLSASVNVASDTSDSTNISCYFVAADTVNGHAALAQLDGEFDDRVPLIGDVTITHADTSVFLRCSSLDSPAHVAGEMIATQVGAITPSL